VQQLQKAFPPAIAAPPSVQLLKIESAGTAAEKALLADVKAKNADATATELLRLFKVRPSVAVVIVPCR
jgi:hypothetical protein